MKNSNQILNILTKQLEACEKYLEVQNQKTQVIIAGDIKELDAIVQLDQSYIMKMESFQTKRQKLLEEDGLLNHTISEIIADYISDELKLQYLETVQNLTKTIEQLKKVNSLNQRLIKERLTIINAVVNEAENKNQIISSDSKNNNQKQYDSKIMRA